MRLLVILIAAMLCSNSVNAQLTELKAYHDHLGSAVLSENSEKARKHYDLGSFETCIKFMFRALESENLEAMDYLILANSLNATGKTALAKEFYQEYLGAIGRNYGPIPDMVEQMFKKDSSEQPIKLVLDTANALYGIYPSEEKFVMRGVSGLVKTEINCDNELITRTFGWSDSYTWKNTGFCFYAGGYKAIISRVNKVSSISRLFKTQLTKDGWSEPEELKFQEKDRNYAFPFFDVNSNILYFSSDQEGSNGGYDLFLSYLVKDRFESSVNLGNQVNTAGHEVFPRTENGYLCFSSNGMPSKGGFDLYKFKSIDDYNYLLINDLKYSSSFDDYDMHPLANKEYLISRFEDSKAVIMHFSKPIPHVEYEIKVKDANGLPISGAVILLESGKYLVTNTSGDAKFQELGREIKQDVKILAQGYKETNTSLLANSQNSITLQAIRSVNIVKVVNQSDSANQQIRYVASDDSVARKETITTENERGVVEPDKGYYYIIVASARDYASAYKSWSKWVETFENLEIIKFNNGLYRIGFKSGRTELTAISQLQNTLKLKKDAWIIRPGSL